MSLSYRPGSLLLRLPVNLPCLAVYCFYSGSTEFTHFPLGVCPEPELCRGDFLPVWELYRDPSPLKIRDDLVVLTA